jgi:hypothetical protein
MMLTLDSEKMKNMKQDKEIIILDYLWLRQFIKNVRGEFLVFDLSNSFGKTETL